VEIGDPTPPPPSEETLIRFISYLSLIRGLAPTTIKTYIAGVRYHLKASARPAFENSFLIQKLLVGCTRSYITENKREGLSLQELNQFLDALPQVSQNPYLAKLFGAAMATSYHGLMRPGELIGSLHAIKFSDVKVFQSKILLTLQHSKANQNGQPEVIEIPKLHGPHCPYKLLRAFLSARPSTPPDFPFFIRGDGSKISSQAYTQIFRDLAVHSTLDPRCKTPHSPRIGKATAMAEEGATSYSIQTAGRWRSNAYKAYIRSDFREGSDLDHRQGPRKRSNGTMGGRARTSTI